MDLEKLERLNKLRESGAITQEEFDSEKNKLFSNQQVKFNISYRKVIFLVVLALGVLLLIVGGVGLVLASSDKKSDSGASALAAELQGEIDKINSRASNSNVKNGALQIFNELKPTIQKEYDNADPCLRGVVSEANVREYDINNDGKMDAILEYSIDPDHGGEIQCGSAWIGSRDVRVILNNGDQLVHIGSIPDLSLQSEISYEPGSITVQNPKWEESDAKCCPSSRVTKKYVIDGDAIIEK
ncbi:MAG: hypothetical protein RL318_648 [Fibrobacterota bacterium]